MSVWRFVVASALFALAGAFQVESSSAQAQPPKKLTVPTDVATIHEAVDLIADGGTVIVAPGTYSETVDVVGKLVNIVGSGRAGAGRPVISGAVPTTVARLADARGLINYGPGGGGRLANLTLVGGDVGVRGFASGRDRPQAVTIKDVSLLKNGRGVAGTFAKLTMDKTLVSGAVAYGVSLICTPALIANSIVGDSGGWGIRVNGCSTLEKVSLNKTTLVGNANGGAIFVGAVQALITTSQFLDNQTAGVVFVEAPTMKNLIFGTLITGTKVNPSPPPGTLYDDLADGVIVLNSGTVTILASSILDNQRCGVLVSAGASQARIGVTNVTLNRFGVVWNDNGKFVDLGGNNISANTEQDLVTSGDLPVPNEPMAVPCLGDADCASGVCVEGSCAE